MSSVNRVWFSQNLETVATWWRVLRRDGVTLGFTSHDDDLWFDGVVHSASPGMMPSAIRRSANFEADSAEVQGALTHETISEADMSAGRFDGAGVVVGLVDWQTMERQAVYRGTIGSVSQEAGTFSASLNSRKAELQIDTIARTSPTCRAQFCGPGCGLAASRFSHVATLVSVNQTANAVVLNTDAVPADLVGGSLRWFDWAYAGMAMGIIGQSAGALVLDRPLDAAIALGARALVREGCDHTLDTCAVRFGNAVNFQGEPFLPGNDLLARYAVPGQ